MVRSEVFSWVNWIHKQHIDFIILLDRIYYTLEYNTSRSNANFTLWDTWCGKPGAMSFYRYHLVYIMLTMPVTSTTAERSFPLNFHKKPQRDFVFDFFLKIYYSLFILIFCSLFFFSTPMCTQLRVGVHLAIKCQLHFVRYLMR
jgi:hypothetical protein